ncbi:MAG: bifunctional adenosylcobinamide kinase/adenosylcobinamide-phosphate guanylyltransferase [Chloroflexi bacterium]|jgi:adenosylcobinamide kinase/adenosylcobinamide-phosphate guanylyltransferase|nr:bifunctional adenosylcobinamide kinase/adenosylcobinamide-phosphate guanylyltransferase [Chloroflexota bacterium]
MAQHLTFILGGARSGKSRFAQRLALARAGLRVIYVATLRETAEVQSDPELQRRLARHRAERPAAWPVHVLDGAPDVVVRAIAEAGARCALLDCLSLFISGACFMGAQPPADPEADAAQAVGALLDAYRASGIEWIIVSNEVGAGIVPENAWARAYRDALGRANQIVAEAADEVFFIAAGLPLRLKG